MILEASGRQQSVSGKTGRDVRQKRNDDGSALSGRKSEAGRSDYSNDSSIRRAAYQCCSVMQ